MRISDWSSDVCSSDLIGYAQIGAAIDAAAKQGELIDRLHIDRRGAEFAGFTTRQNVETEAKLLRIEAEGRGALSPIASQTAAAKAIAVASTQANRKSVVLGRRASVRRYLVGRRQLNKNIP